jgi:hypothetical protein
MPAPIAEAGEKPSEHTLESLAASIHHFEHVQHVINRIITYRDQHKLPQDGRKWLSFGDSTTAR